MVEVFIELEAPGLKPEWVEKVAQRVIGGETKQDPGDLTMVLVNDGEIQRLNLTFLNKDCPTDVIAFPLEDDEDTVWGEVYISVERARVQARQFHVPDDHELARLIIHGVLHLLGYDDLVEEKKVEMTAREEHYLELLASDGVVSLPDTHQA